MDVKWFAAIVVIAGGLGWLFWETSNQVDVSLEENTNKRQPLLPSKQAKPSDNKRISPRELADEVVIAEIESLIHCYEQDNCQIPQNEPRAHFFIVGQKITDAVRILIKKSDPSVLNAEYVELAQELIQFENDQVKEAALDLMASQPPIDSNVNAIVGGMQQSHDASLYQQIIVEFQRYPDPGQQQQITDFMMETIKTGGHYASRTVAKSVLPLMNEQNVEAYQTLQDELPKDSQRYQFLNQTLLEYNRIKSGG